jgi:excisionase family DNA binding protein
MRKTNESVNRHIQEGKDKPMGSPQEGAPQRLLLRIPEVAETLGIGRTKIYEMIATGELPTVRVGRAVRISISTLQKWVEEREQQNVPIPHQDDAKSSKLLH